jgi:hypothetical protein
MPSSLGKRKRPCRICRRWFVPDPRVGERQHVCQRAACQAERQRRNHEAWCRHNPGYFTARRLEERAAESDPEPPRMPPPLGRLPWDLAQRSSGSKARDSLEVLADYSLVVRKSKCRVKPLDSLRDLVD